MVVKGGRHKLVGMVALGQFYKDAKQIETGKPSENCNIIGVDVQFFRHISVVIYCRFYVSYRDIKYSNSNPSIAVHILERLWIQVSLAHFPTAQCPSSTLYLQFWEGVLQMRKAGFKYVHIAYSTI